MLSCKEVTHLLSEAQDRKITLPERVNLEMHLAVCKGCKNFRNQRLATPHPLRLFSRPRQQRSTR